MDSLSTSHLQWVPDGMGVGRAGWARFFFWSPVIGRKSSQQALGSAWNLTEMTTSDYRGEGTQKRLSRNIDCSLTL